MGAHSNHHFIPVFLLEKWQGGSDGKLSALRWRQNRIHEDRHKAKTVAKERHLYAIEKSEPQPNQVLEREFMAKEIDEPAAIVHAAVIKDGVGKLTESQQYTWTRFLVSLALRGPGAVEYIRARGVAALSEQLDADPDGFAEHRAAVDAPTLRTYVEQHDSDVLRDFGSLSLPHIIQTTGLNKLIFEAQWMMRRLTKQSRRLLIGDRPLTLFGAIAEEFLLYLPVTPDSAFFAFNSAETGRRIRTKTESLLVRELNRGMVEQASVYLYGVNGEYRPLLESRLAKVPAEPGIGFGPRPTAVTDRG